MEADLACLNLWNTLYVPLFRKEKGSMRFIALSQKNIWSAWKAGCPESSWVKIPIREKWVKAISLCQCVFIGLLHRARTINQSGERLSPEWTTDQSESLRLTALNRLCVPSSSVMRPPPYILSLDMKFLQFASICWQTITCFWILETRFSVCLKRCRDYLNNM